MARDAQLYVRIADDRTAAQLTRAGFSSAADGDWLHIVGASPGEDAARQLSMTLATTAVWWTIETVTGQLTLLCFQYGVQVRKLHYASAVGWSTIAGRPQPFESAVLDAWLARRHLAVLPDGYDVLECFLGRPRAPEGAFIVPGPRMSDLQTAQR